MRYWLLLEYLCEEFKEDSTEFNISTSVFSSRIYIKHIKKLESFAQILTEISEKFDGNSIEIQKVSNNFWKIKTDILLKLMSRDYKKARNNRATTAPKKENKKKNKKKNNNTTEMSDKSDELVFNFEYIYNAYPRKEGKTRGLEKLKSQIKTEQDYLSLQEAVKNYSEQTAGQDKKYIKQFSSFVSVWRDYLEPVEFGDPFELAREKFCKKAEAEDAEMVYKWPNAIELFKAKHKARSEGREFTL